MEHETLTTFSAVVKNLSREEFVQHHAHPFIVGQGKTSSAPTGRRAFQTMAGFQIAKEADPTSNAEKDLPVFRVTKSDRNTFGKMVTLGRIDNNDIILDHPSTSKFHAYFTPGNKDNEYTLCDADSKYGTFLDDKRLRPSLPQRLTAGATIVFGKGIKYSYFPPGDFFDFVKVLQGLRKL